MTSRSFARSASSFSTAALRARLTFWRFTSSRPVDEVDGLIGQKTVRDVTLGHGHRDASIGSGSFTPWNFS